MGAAASTFGLMKRDVSCHGAKNGFAFICASVGTAILKNNVYITWKKEGVVIREQKEFSDISESDEVEGLSPGNYTVCIVLADTPEEAANEEPEIMPFTIEEPPRLKVSIDVLEGNTCDGHSLARATVRGAQGNVTYKWSRVCGDGHKVVGRCRKVKGLYAGLYTITVADDSGCKAFKCFQVGPSCQH